MICGQIRAAQVQLFRGLPTDHADFRRWMGGEQEGRAELRLGRGEHVRKALGGPARRGPTEHDRRQGPIRRLTTAATEGVTPPRCYLRCVVPIMGWRSMKALA